LDDFTLTLSIGIAEWADGKTLDEALDIADRDMYTKKDQPAPPPDEKSRSATAGS
jgi:GGDEF domain-containing protein